MTRLASAMLGESSVGRYAVIGVSGVAVDLILFAVLVQLHVHPALATGLSTTAGILNNYFLNARYNFMVPPNLRDGARFFLVGTTGLFVSVLAVQALVDGIGIAPIPAKLSTLPLVLTAQFLANKHWSFGPSLQR